MGALGNMGVTSWSTLRALGAASLLLLGLAQACGGAFREDGTHPSGGDAGEASNDAGEVDGDAAGEVDGGAASKSYFVDLLSSRTVTKVDLLFMVDNSIGMADKQALFTEAIPALVQRLVSPRCVDATDGTPNRDGTPADPTASCPASFVREFAPIRDVHVGVITSSIGGHGAALCNGADTSAPAIENEEQNDHGYLVGVRPRYQNPPGGFPADSAGFLDFSPDRNPSETVQAFTTTFRAMTTAAGEFGCGLESQMESIYRFLVDPNPYQQIVTTKCPSSNDDCAVPKGKDENLLAQRAAFLRADSLVAIVMLSDENDCSIQESGENYYAARSEIILPHGSSVCATNPNDKCCYFCNSAPPSGCAADPTCSGASAQTDARLDPPNLRCWHEKQRFGFDFLYPTARYVNAFSQPQICTSRADLAPDPVNCPDLDGDKRPDIFDNPLFLGANDSAAIPRDSSLIFVAGIVGVPWQDIRSSVRPDGTAYDSSELHFATAAQLVANGTWSVILGDSGEGTFNPPIVPTDALMIESKDPRGGTDGENPPRPLAPPSSPRNTNPVNGHEWNDTNGDDLQYACIFPLKQTRDCAQELMKSPAPGCDCAPGSEADQNPLCEAASGDYSTIQWAAKAYPGLRELQVLKDFGANAVVASVCPRNVTDDTQQDYGYGPAVDALGDRLAVALVASCLPRTLTPVTDPKTNESAIPCDVLEVVADDGKSCADLSGRSDADKAVVAAAHARLVEAKLCDVAGKPSCDTFRICRIDEAGSACHQNVAPSETGWCYIDPAQNPDDDPSLVAGCPVTERRRVRFVDPKGETPAPDATLLIVCH